MKKIFLTSFLFVFVVFVSGQLRTPAPSPTQTIKQDFGISSIELIYSRPGVKGRKIFGDLVPWNKVWRTGANSATRIKFIDDVTFGGQALKAGEYALYTLSLIHISEPTRLGMISYAVFCLKKKK